jgi:hypothetical protein
VDGEESAGGPYELNQLLPIALSHWDPKGPARTVRNVRGLPAASRLRTGVESAGGRRMVAAERAPADPKDGEEM